MKTFLTFISALLISVSVNAQTQYEQGMEQAFTIWGTNDIEATSNLFERIAKAEKENWLPYYYVALVNTLDTFTSQDRSKVKTRLEKAQEFLNLSETYTKNNEETRVLQALIYTAHVFEDGAKAQQLSPKIEAIYQKALQTNPKNPRVVICFADWKIGAAKYFKQDTTPYCKAIEKGLLLFDAETPKVPFAPSWGKERALQLISECEN